MQQAKQKPKFRITPPGYQVPRWRFLLPMAMFAIVDCLLVSTPTFVGQTVDNFAANNAAAAWPLVALLGGIVLVLILNELVSYRVVVQTMVLLETKWRSYAGKLVPKLSAKSDPGEIISVIVKDSKQIGMFAQVFPDMAGSIAVAVVGTWQLWRISPRVAIAALSGIVITMVFIAFISKLLEKRAATKREHTGINASRAADIAGSLRTIAGLGAGKEMLRRYRVSADQLRNSNLAYERVSVWIAFTRLLLIGLTTLVAVAFALAGAQVAGVWETEIPPGQLIAVAGTVTMMVGPIWVVEMFFFGLRNTRVALERFEMLEQQAGVSGENTETVDKVSAVAFAVANGESPEKTAAGQAAQIVPALPKNREIVYIDPRAAGLSAQHYTEQLAAQLRQEQEMLPAAERERILLSESNPMIFGGTLAEHLQLGAKGLSQQEMQQLLEITDSLEIAYRLGGTNPDEYFAAMINSEGTNLSGGQRQRLALARALAQHAEVMIFAEPLNSVDEPSQKYIYNELEKRLGVDPQFKHIKQLVIVSTTAQVQERIARDSAIGGGTEGQEA